MTTTTSTTHTTGFKQDNVTSNEDLQNHHMHKHKQHHHLHNLNNNEFGPSFYQRWRLALLKFGQEQEWGDVLQTVCFVGFYVLLLGLLLWDPTATTTEATESSSSQSQQYQQHQQHRIAARNDLIYLALLLVIVLGMREPWNGWDHGVWLTVRLYAGVVLVVLSIATLAASSPACQKEAAYHAAFPPLLRIVY